MKRSKALALIVAAAFTISAVNVSEGGAPPPPVHAHSSNTPWVAWIVIGCSSLIVLTAMIANQRDNRQLTSPEAWTCGLEYWFKRK